MIFFTSAVMAQTNSEFYTDRYKLSDVYRKLVDNRGQGREDLYGVRNFREVLKGVLYRGGANNMFHRENPRHNSNPLPPDGLDNLCQEGFENSVYLYSTNFHTAAPQTACHSVLGVNQLHYFQLSPNSKYREILEMVYDTIGDPTRGPMYVHCWNGWHASGQIAAMALMQFCGVSARDAVRYWEIAADRTDDGNYEAVKRRIRNFKPYADLAIDPQARARICHANVLP